MQKPRYAVFHVSEPGWETAEEAQAWIDRQRDPKEYYIVATVGELPKQMVSMADSETAHKVRAAVRQAVAKERDRIKIILGIR